MPAFILFFVFFYPQILLENPYFIKMKTYSDNTFFNQCNTNKNRILSPDYKLLILLILFFLCSVVFLFISMNECKGEKSGFNAVIEIFPLNLFWRTSGRAEILELNFAQYTFENEAGKSIRENDNPFSPSHSRYILKCKFAYKDSKNNIKYCGICYSIHKKMTANRDVEIWCGLHSTAKIKNTHCSPVQPSFLFSMLVMPIIYLVCIFCVLFKISNRLTNKNNG